MQAYAGVHWNLRTSRQLLLLNCLDLFVSENGAGLSYPGNEYRQEEGITRLQEAPNLIISSSSASWLGRSIIGINGTQYSPV